jgi:hypothetical protein
VYLNGALLTTGYSVASLGLASTTVTFMTPPANGASIVLVRTMPLTQDTDITNQGKFLPEIHEDAFDARVMQIQQVADDSTRSLKLPLTSTNNGEIPNWNALGPLVVSADAQGVEVGSTALTGDMLLRPNLADSSAGKGAAMVAFKQLGTGAVPRLLSDKLGDTISVKDFGAKGDGTTDDTAAVQACINAATAVGKETFFPGGTYLCGKLTIPSQCQITGESGERSKIKLKNGANTNLLESTSFQAYALTGSPNIGDVGIKISRITIDGNASNNTSASDKLGAGIALYGERICLREVYIMNCAGHGMVTDGPLYGGGDGDWFGMEAHFERIVIDTAGKHGWYMNGPHDSTSMHVIVINAGASADNTWDALYANSPCRFISYHGWSRGTNNRRHRFALNLRPGGGGCQFIGGQFEGSATANVNLNASGSQFDSTCAYYAACGGTNIYMGGTCAGNSIKGYLGPPPSGFPDVIGVSISNNAADYVRANIIELLASEQKSTNIFFGAADKGNNSVRINGFQSAGATYTGTPHSTDVVDILIHGSSNISYAPLRPVAYVTFNGTVASPTMGSRYNVSSVTKTATGKYTINFASSIPLGASMTGTCEPTLITGRAFSNNANSQDVEVRNTSGALTDSAICTVMLYGN